MEEENGGKIAECGESSITPPVNNSERKRLLLKLSVPTKMELFLISFCCVLPHSADEHSLFHEQASTHLTLDYLRSPSEIPQLCELPYKISDSFPLISCEVFGSQRKCSRCLVELYIPPTWSCIWHWQLHENSETNTTSSPNQHRFTFNQSAVHGATLWQQLVWKAQQCSRPLAPANSRLPVWT